MPSSRLKQAKSSFQITSGTVGYLFVAGLVLGVAIYTQGNLLFWAFGLMVGGMLVSLVASWLMMRKLSVERIAPSHGVAGESMVLRYRLENHKGWTPVFGLVVQETWGRGRRGWKRSGPIADRPQRLRGRPHGWVLHLGPRQSAQAEAPCWPLRRGPLTFERIVLSCSFPFSIIRRVVEFEEPGQVLVYPHLYRINRRLLYRISEVDPQGRKRLERGGGHEEFFGLRDYRAGDSFKTIDWKRSAKNNRLISREMTQPSPPKIMIVLDLGNLDAIWAERDEVLQRHRRRTGKAGATADELLLGVERAISLTASLVCDAYFNGYQIGLAVQGVRFVTFPVHHSLPHRTRILEALARLDLSLRSDRKAPLPSKPSVVVCPGAASTPSAANQTVIGAREMDQFVVELEGGSSMLLGRHSTRRQGTREPAPQEQA